MIMIILIIKHNTHAYEYISHEADEEVDKDHPELRLEHR